MVTTEVDPEDAGRYGVVQVDGAGERLRLQAGRAEGQPDQQRGLRVRARAGARHARRAGRASNPRTASRTSATSCCRGWSTRARCASTDSTATGATWARSRRTGSATGAGRRRAADRPRRPGLADPHARDREPRVGACSGGTIERSLIGPGARSRATWRQRDRARRGRRGGAVVRGSVVLPGPSCARRPVERAILDDGVEVRRDVGGRRRDRARRICGPDRRDSAARGRRRLPNLQEE